MNKRHIRDTISVKFTHCIVHKWPLFKAPILKLPHEITDHFYKLTRHKIFVSW